MPLQQHNWRGAGLPFCPPAKSLLAEAANKLIVTLLYCILSCDYITHSSCISCLMLIHRVEVLSSSARKPGVATIQNSSSFNFNQSTKVTS